MTLYNALRILAETHTRDHDRMGFVIEVGAPSPYTMKFSMNEYMEAWRVLRVQLGMQAETDAR